MKIAVDCGHCLSGSDTGARGNGYEEEVLTREVGAALEKLLSVGNIVKFVNCDSASSVNSSLSYRVSQANSFGADLFVSIHFNSGGGTGTETYIYAAGGKAEQYAKRVNAKLVEYGFKDRGVKTGNLYVIKNTKMPAILVECCFLDSLNDMKKYNPNAIAKAIAEGIENKSIDTIPEVPSKPSNTNTSQESFAPGDLCTTDASGLNLRSIGSTSGSILATIKRGDVFTYNYVDEKYLGWYNVTFVGNNGFVSAEYVKKAKSNYNGQVVGVSSKLNVRSNPNGSIIGSLNPNEKIQILEESNGWIKVKYDTSAGKLSKIGWVSVKYIKRV